MTPTMPKLCTGRIPGAKRTEEKRKERMDGGRDRERERESRERKRNMEQKEKRREREERREQRVQKKDRAKERKGERCKLLTSQPRVVYSVGSRFNKFSEPHKMEPDKPPSGA